MKHHWSWVVVTVALAIAGLVIVADEPGGTNPVHLHVDRTIIAAGESIRGNAFTEGDPPVIVEVRFNGQKVDYDEDPESEDGRLNEFWFPSRLEWGGHTVQIVAIDSSGKTQSVTVIVVK